MIRASETPEGILRIQSSQTTWSRNYFPGMFQAIRSKRGLYPWNILKIELCDLKGIFYICLSNNLKLTFQK